MNKGYPKPKREHARGDWPGPKGSGGKSKVGRTKSGSSAPLEKKTHASGLPKATGGWPESPLGKPRPTSFRDPNPGMEGVHIHGGVHHHHHHHAPAMHSKGHMGKAHKGRKK